MKYRTLGKDQLPIKLKKMADQDLCALVSHFSIPLQIPIFVQSPSQPERPNKQHRTNG
jgi:hypothetical protein